MQLRSSSEKAGLAERPTGSRTLTAHTLWRGREMRKCKVPAQPLLRPA